MARAARVITFEYVNLEDGFSINMAVPYSWDNFRGLLGIPQVRYIETQWGYFKADGSAVILNPLTKRVDGKRVPR